MNRQLLKLTDIQSGPSFRNEYVKKKMIRCNNALQAHLLLVINENRHLPFINQ